MTASRPRRRCVGTPGRHQRGGTGRRTPRRPLTEEATVSGALERLGRIAARRPWVVIATWAAVCLVVLTSAASFGRELDDPFEAPGLDSQRATELLTQAGAERHGSRRRRRPHAARPVGEPLRLPSSAGRCSQGPGSRGGAAPRARHERPGRRARRGPAVRRGLRGRLARRRGRPDPDPVPRPRATCRPPTWSTSRRPSTTFVPRRPSASRPAATCTSRSSRRRPMSAKPSAWRSRS